MILATKRAGPPRVGLGDLLLYLDIESVAVQQKVFAQRARGGASLGQALLARLFGVERERKSKVRYGFALEIRASLTPVREGDGIGTRGSVPKENLALLSRRAGVSFAWCFWLAREEGGVLRRQSGQQTAKKNADADDEEKKTNSRRRKITRSQKEKRARARVDHVVGRWADGGGGGGL